MKDSAERGVAGRAERHHESLTESEHRRNMKHLTLALGALLCAAIVSCSDDGGGGKSTSGGGSGGSTSGGAGNKSGGTSATAGGGGSATGGSAPSGAHCTPGTPQASFNYFGDIIDRCGTVEGLTGDVSHIEDIALPRPLAPGQKFAFSTEMKSPEGDFEMYGATEKCGAVGEKLSTVHLTGSGIVCHEVAPITGTYTHLIWVWRVRGEMVTTAMCEAGTCPAQ